MSTRAFPLKLYTLTMESGERYTSKVLFFYHPLRASLNETFPSNVL